MKSVSINTRAADRIARSAGFQTCRIADFQVGVVFNVVRPAGLETRNTADLEVCATTGATFVLQI
jgi:hypothetical protein